MSYATRDDLLLRFGAVEISQLADRDGDGVEDDGVIQAALDDAQATIDSYLRGRYGALMPFSVVSPELISANCKLARFSLWGSAVSERVAQDQSDTLRWLRDLSSGAAALMLPSDAAPGGDDLTPVFSAPARTFTPDSFDDYLDVCGR